ncbi:MAG TPA: hypothetical protein VF681_10495 [Abditibacteriaceae bacterium]
MNIRALLSFSVMALVLPSVSPSVQADIAPEPMSGGISLEAPGSSRTEIVLLDNVVKMHVSPKLCKTRAFFRLNNTGKTTALEVGFPLLYKGEAADFLVFVDNKRVGFKDRTQATKTPIGQPHTRRWKVWTMQFKRGATRSVEVRYSNRLAHGVYWGSEGKSYPSFLKWRRTRKDYNLADYGYPARIELHEFLSVKTVEYVLTTGSYWKGPIKHCRVEVNIDNVATDSIVEVRPLAKFFSTQRLVWEWTNVEPARNVVITFVGGMSPRQTTIPYLEKVAARNPLDEELQETLNGMKRDFSSARNIKERQERFIQRSPATR